MGSLKDAVENGKAHSKRGRKRQMDRRKVSGKATASGIFLVFKDAMSKHNYGASNLLTKQDFNMLNGFIKVALNNNMEDSWIYATIETVVSKWDRLKRMPVLTKNNKSWKVSDRPSLRDFLICRDSFLDNLDQLRREKAVDGNKLMIETSMASEIVQKGPTDEEMELEYERMLGDL
jgi:hypothetical protein